MKRLRNALLCVVMLAPAVAAADAEPVSFGEGGLKMGEAVLFEGSVSGAAYDPAQELIWFRSDGTLHVVDLRAESLAPVKIITRLPDEGAFEIAGASKAGFLTGQDQWVISYPTLLTGKKTKLSSVQHGDFGTNGGGDDEARAQIKKAKIVGAKWLKTLAKRKARAVPRHTINKTINGKLTLPASISCEDEEQCGTVLQLGASRFAVVVTAVEYMPGAVFTQCLLYDTRHKKFASPTTSGTWKEAEPEQGPCEDFHTSLDGKSYLVGRYRCTFDQDKITCEEGEGTYIGWAEQAAPPPPEEKPLPPPL